MAEAEVVDSPTEEEKYNYPDLREASSASMSENSSATQEENRQFHTSTFYQ